jgi:GPI-anchor transamidase subunit S
MASAPSEQAQASEPVETTPATAAAAPDGVKLPPPEKPSATRQRSYIVLSFWLIIVLLGLPFWWKTTEVYRADLPIDAMLQWADGKVCSPFGRTYPQAETSAG